MDLLRTYLVAIAVCVIGSVLSQNTSSGDVNTESTEETTSTTTLDPESSTSSHADTGTTAPSTTDTEFTTISFANTATTTVVTPVAVTPGGGVNTESTEETTSTTTLDPVSSTSSPADTGTTAPSTTDTEFTTITSANTATTTAVTPVAVTPVSSTSSPADTGTTAPSTTDTEFTTITSANTATTTAVTPVAVTPDTGTTAPSTTDTEFTTITSANTATATTVTPVAVTPVSSTSSHEDTGTTAPSTTDTEFTTITSANTATATTVTPVAVTPVSSTSSHEDTGTTAPSTTDTEFTTITSANTATATAVTPVAVTPVSSTSSHEDTGTTAPSTTTAVTPVVVTPVSVNITGKCNQTDETYISDNTSVVVGCIFSSYPSRNLNITCQRGDTLMSTSSRIFYKTGRENFLFSVQLKFIPILRRDRGNYSCKATVGESSLEIPFSILVYEGPTVTLSPSTLSLQEGDQRNFTCQVNNALAVKTVPGSLVWCQADVVITDPSKIVRVGDGMEILMMNSSDADGVYKCGVINCTESATLVMIGQEDKFCTGTTDTRGTVWPLTVGNTTMVLPCPGRFLGKVQRVCDVTGEWGEPNYINCTREEIAQIEEEVAAITEGTVSSEAVKNVLENLQNATQNNDSSAGDLDKSIDIVDKLVSAVSGSNTIVIDITATQTFINVIDNILSVNTSQQAWKQLQLSDEKKVSSLMKSVTSFGLAAAKSQAVNTPLSVNSSTLVMEVANITKQDIIFPFVNLEEIGDSLRLPKENFRTSEKITYVAAYYRTMTEFLPPNNSSGGVANDKNVNSRILALAVEIDGDDFSDLNMNVSLNFHSIETNYSEPACGYWDFDKGSWLTDGCTSTEVNESFTRCDCNHLTNFAILMSPGRTVPEEDLNVLKIISIVGCSLSILGCVVTVLTHVCLWSYVRSSKSVILLNLCVALTCAYSVFLAGVERTENKAVCTAVAAMLHYFFLAAFSLMFAQGVDITLQVVHVFREPSKLKIVLPLAWGVPAVIVGITLGVTRLEGYGNDQFCWLTVTDGVLYAFVGPVLFVVLANSVIIIIILRALCSTKLMVTKRRRERATTTVRSLCVLMPVLGVAWVCGVLAINNYTVIFQYLFASFNSLQGFLIFIMHCLFNRAIIDGVRKAKARYETNKTTSKSLPDSRNNWKYEEKPKNQKEMTEIPTDYDSVSDSDSYSDDQSDKASALRLKKMSQDNDAWQKAAYNNRAYLPRPQVRLEEQMMPSQDYSESSGDNIEECFPDYPAEQTYRNPVFIGNDDDNEPAVLKIARPSYKTHL
ncbi:serine-rich adhesin for platelets-like isoform X5 [Haliotis rufescens]|uniref:serine-rich adhesin for platelets-like isoform X5 n=1 Tax=Haliotis rufescens TaxID=6454 RepID=UPI00201F0343|nr:serine-rich adhesin for platelets-like isoform X5 [Haliotis rufescens]